MWAQWNDALSVSATIEQDYRLVEKYLENGQIVGSAMCAIALLSWYMTLGKEITHGACFTPRVEHSTSQV